MLEALQPNAILLADRAYDSDAIRTLAAGRGAWANIPPKKNRTGSFSFSAWLYKQRNLVERYFNKLKHFRGIATRYDRDPLNFLAAIKLASVRIWLRAYESAA
jgi:transposase